MKKTFKKLTQEDIEYISAIYHTNISHNEKIEILTRTNEMLLKCTKTTKFKL